MAIDFIGYKVIALMLPWVGGIRKWEVTSAGRIGVDTIEVIWIDEQTREEWQWLRDTANDEGVVE